MYNENNAPSPVLNPYDASYKEYLKEKQSDGLENHPGDLSLKQRLP